MALIVTKEIFRNEVGPDLRAKGKKIVLCHGVFDLVHPGHLAHFEQAKAMGDVLIVSITAAKYVRKGPGRPYFSDEMRLKFLSSIEYIDYVILSEGFTVDDIVETVEPDIYVKGQEYAKMEDDITGKMIEEKSLVEKHGGKVCFTNGEVFSSTKLINIALAGLPNDVRKYMESFSSQFSMQDIKNYTAKAEELKVLVIGDIIIDQYSYCNVQGLMSKDMGYSARLENTEAYLGGAAAVARHLSTFTNNVTLMSIIGQEMEIKKRINTELSEEMKLDLVFSKVFPTIIKHRYLTKNTMREEYRKVFAINNIPQTVQYEQDVIEEFRKRLNIQLEQNDIVFLCDFGHGLINSEIMELIQKKAKFLVLNCQTNSSNYGMNIITKYHKADLFALDQRELKLAYPQYELNERKAMKVLSRELGSNGWLTRGSMGAYGIQNGEIHQCPALTLSVKDTIGAGDAFLAIAGLYVAAEAPIEIGTLMGNIGGALCANILGNKEAVEKVNVLKFASTLMNI